MAFVLVLAGMAAGVYMVVGRTVGKDEAKANPERKVSVFLCLKGSTVPNCKNQAATDLQKEEIRKRLESMPKVGSVTYQSQEQAYAIFKKKFADEKDLMATVRPDDLPDSFRVRAADDAAANALKAALSGAPGVETVYIEPRRQPRRPPA